MTTATTLDVPATAGAGRPVRAPDHRGSWIPNLAMIRTRFMELRKRRGLMAALIVVNIGLPTIFLAVRLIAHAADPKAFGPAGGYSIFTAMVSGVMFIFGFIVAATLGTSAGSMDLSEGVFRHLVVTGRSRLALYLARIPAGLAIVVPVVAVGFAIVCTVCVFAAPTQLNFDGVNVPAGLSQPALASWAGQHGLEVDCNFFPSNLDINCAQYGGPGLGQNGQQVFINGQPSNTPAPQVPATAAQIRQQAEQFAHMAYGNYASQFLYPTTTLMIDAGLWIELEAVLGFLIGLGLASLLGQRTISIVLMVVLELIITPLFSRPISHIIPVQRGLYSLAMDHLVPGNLPLPFTGGGGGPNGGGAHQLSMLVSESRPTAALVVVGWIIVWTALGAWRMVRRDA